MDTSYVLFAVLLFVAVVLALEGGYTMWASKSSAEAKRLAARLRTVGGGASAEAPLSIERTKRRSHWSWLDDHLIELLPNGGKLMRYLETSGTGIAGGACPMWPSISSASPGCKRLSALAKVKCWRSVWSMRRRAIRRWRARLPWFRPRWRRVGHSLACWQRCLRAKA